MSQNYFLTKMVDHDMERLCVLDEKPMIREETGRN
jgi:hypothetical protein